MRDSPVELASRLASRLCHDFNSLAGGILAGVELLLDPASPIPREEALSLVSESATTLAAQLAFARVAFGAGGTAIGVKELRTLAESLFVSIRPTLTWSVGALTLTAAAERVLLNLVQLAAAALALGGEVIVSADQGEAGARIWIDAVGPKARLHPEVAAGLGGLELSDGLAGRWVQGAYVYALVSSVGGDVSAEVREIGLKFIATLP